MKAYLETRKTPVRHLRSSLVGCVAAFAFALTGLIASAGTPAQVLLQTNEVVGTQEVTFCPLGLKVRAIKDDFIFVMSPPSWKVTLYSPAKKVYYQTKPELWFGPLGETVESTWEDRFKQLRVISNSTGKYQGLTARHILWISKFDPMNTKDPDDRTLAKKNRLELLSKSAEQWCTEDRPYLKEMSFVMSRFYHTPLAQGLPLAFAYDGFSGTRHELLYSKILKNRMCTAADFEPPKGMRLVREPREVVFTNKDSTSLLDVLRP